MSQPSTVERAPTGAVTRLLPEPPARDASPPTEAGVVLNGETLPPSGDLPSIAGRDFASALDLIREASEAVRQSEERANDLEHQFAQATARSSEQIQSLEGQVAATERRLQKAEERARAAEARAAAAETWLVRIHDAVMSSFKRPQPPPQRG